jgi:hypothetical protein
LNVVRDAFKHVTDNVERKTLDVDSADRAMGCFGSGAFTT